MNGIKTRIPEMYNGASLKTMKLKIMRINIFVRGSI
jgi:hypothetical protein